MWLLLCIIPFDPVTDSVQEIEINHVYDCHAKPIFTQVIIWERNLAGDNDVRCWWMVKSQSDLPSSGEVLRFDGGVMRRVRAGRVFETWTQTDPEVEHRQRLPVEMRRGLVSYKRPE